MMNVAQIRGWLLNNPRPAILRVLGEDDAEHEMALAAGVKWADIAQSIHALNPARIDAYDREGKILRSVRPADVAEPKQPTERAAALPAGTDPNILMLTHFADLLAAAYRHSTDVAFDRMVSLFEAVNERQATQEKSLESLHKLLRRALQDQVEAAGEAVPQKRELLEDIVEGFVQGAVANGANGAHTNGQG